MRSAKLGLLFVSAFSFACGVVACSSDDGGTDDTGEDSGSDASVVDSGKTPAKDASTGTPDAGHDSSTGGGHDNDAAADSAADAGADGAIDSGADVGIVDAQPDVALPPPVDAGAPGTPCAPANAVGSQSCGMCGTQQRLCLVGDGGAVWADWGACLNEVQNGCVPGTTDNESCGMCGHRTKICQLDCVFATGSCQGQPPNACEPGTTNFVEGLSCDAGAGRSQTCDNTCSWGSFGTCAAPDYGAPLSIATTIAGTVTSVRQLLASPALAVLRTGACPTAIATPGSKNAFSYVNVANPTSKTAKVSIWFSKAPGGVDIDTVIAAYPGGLALPPLTDAARASCLNVGPANNFDDVADYCYSENSVPTECLASWGGLVADGFEDDSVTIPPNSSVWIYAGAQQNTSSTSPHSGNFQINARTESLN